MMTSYTVSKPTLHTSRVRHTGMGQYQRQGFKEVGNGIQMDCLRRIIGAKAHTSSVAIEVECGIVPFRFRKRELCCREYIRIQAKSQGCDLKKLMEASTRVGLRFCPLEYIKTVS